MPLNPSLRTAELDGLLHQLRNELAERWVEDVLFDPRDSTFAGYHNTAWAELERKLLVARKAAFGWTGFYLTPRGWLVSIMGDEWSTAPDWAQKRVHQLVKTLKDHCDRDSIDPVRVPLIEVSTESGVPAGWLRNAVVSRMAMHVVKDKHIDAWYEDEQIVIGPGFGHPRLQ